MPAMIYFHFIHKTSEAADIRDKYEALVVSSLVEIKITKNCRTIKAQKIWQKGHHDGLIFALLKGSLAQLVQSICLTSR